MTTLPIKSPKFMAMVDRRLRELGLSRTDFIRKLTKESIQQKLEPPSRNWMYRVLNGTILIGEDNMLPRFCKSLGLNLKDAVAALRDDKISAKGWARSSANKTVHDATVLMETLSKRDQEDVLKYVQMKAGI